MPAVFAYSTHPTSLLLPSTNTIYARAVSSSEAASLKGGKAKTPIIAGSICGGLLGIAWIIGLIIYLRKRSKRKERKRLIAAGKASPREKDLKIPDETIVIPPDPAVLLGQCEPGEYAFSTEHQQKHKSPLPSESSRSQVNTRSAPTSPSLISPRENTRTPVRALSRGEDRISEVVTVPSRT